MADAVCSSNETPKYVALLALLAPDGGAELVTARHLCQDIFLFSSCLATSLEMHIYSSPCGGG